MSSSSGPHHDLYVTLNEKDRVGSVFATTYRITFSAEHGLRIHTTDKGTDVVSFVLDSDNPYSGLSMRTSEPIILWFARVLRGSISMFSSAYIWAFTMACLQVLALLLLTFEAHSPRHVLAVTSNVTTVGLVDEHNLIRFISDNIAVHRGFGSLMLLAFAGSYILLVCVFMDPVTRWLLIFVITLSSAGGMGVVLFHFTYHVEHLVGAVAFISGGLLAHIIVASTSIRNSFMYNSFIAISAVLAALFLSFYIVAHVSTDGERNDRKFFNVSYVTNNTIVWEVNTQTYNDTWFNIWWLAGLFEYLLYISMIALNVLIPDQIINHTAQKFAHMLPTVIRAYNNRRTD